MIETLESRLLLASVLDGTLILEGTSGDDRIIVSQRNSTLIVRENNHVSQFPLAGLINISYVQSPGNDYVKVTSQLKADLIAGDGDDTLIGGSGNDNFSGDAGNDLILGRAGDDVLNAGIGHDKVIGGAGNDFITGQDSDRDTLLGGAGDDSASFDPGTDVGSQIEHPFITMVKMQPQIRIWQIRWNREDGRLPQRMPRPLERSSELRIIQLPHNPFNNIVQVTPVGVYDVGETFTTNDSSYGMVYDSQFGAGAFNALFKFQNISGKTYDFGTNTTL